MTDHQNLDDGKRRAVASLPDAQHHAVLESILRGIVTQQNASVTKIRMNHALYHKDGGIDGEVEGYAGPDNELLPQGDSRFQVKAERGIPKGLQDEMAPDGNIRKNIKEIWARGGTYVFVEWRERPTDRQDEALRVMQEIATSNEAKAEQVRYACVDDLCKQIARLPATQATLDIMAMGISHEQLGRQNVLKDTLWHPDVDREQAVDRLRDEWKGDRSCVRIAGPSGIGKTRLVYEAAKEPDDALRVIYCADLEALQRSDAFNRLLSKTNMNAILVIDNCSTDSQDRLWAQLDRDDLFVHLVAIGEPGNPRDGRLLNVDRLGNEELTQLIKDINGELEEGPINTIVAWTEGFPGMARLFAQYTRTAGEEALTDFVEGKLRAAVRLILEHVVDEIETDDDEGARIHKALQLIAVLGRLSTDTEESPEAKWLREKCHLDAHRLRVLLDKLQERGLADGRVFRKLKPIAVRLVLIRDWFDVNASSRDAMELYLNQVTEENPVAAERLARGLSAEIDKLNDSALGMELARQLLDEDGWFRELKDLSDRTLQRFLEGLVRCAPDLALAAIARLIDGATDREIEDTTDARRTLVSSLEVTLFHDALFDESMRLLQRLALHENEAWSNNAEGVFVKQFQAGPGKVATTQKEPCERLKHLEPLIHDGGDMARKILSDSLNSALRCDFFVRDSGPEYQGLRAPLMGWMPENYDSARSEYIAAVLDVVERLFSNEELRGTAVSAVANTARTVVAKTPSHASRVLSLLVGAYEKGGDDRLEALKAIVDLVHYDRDRLDPSVINPWIDAEDALTSGGLAARLDRWILINPIHDEIRDSRDATETQLSMIAQEMLNSMDDPWVVEQISGAHDNKPRMRRLMYHIGELDEAFYLRDVLDVTLPDAPNGIASYLQGLWTHNRESAAGWMERHLLDEADGPIAAVMKSAPASTRALETIRDHLLEAEEPGPWTWAIRQGLPLRNTTEEIARGIVFGLLEKGAAWAWEMAAQSVYMSFAIAKTQRLETIGKGLVWKLLSEVPAGQLTERGSQEDRAWGGIAGAALFKWPDLARAVISTVLRDGLISGAQFIALDYWVNDAMKKAFQVDAKGAWTATLEAIKEAGPSRGSWARVMHYILGDDVSALSYISADDLVATLSEDIEGRAHPIMAALPRPETPDALVLKIVEALGNEDSILEGARMSISRDGWGGEEAPHVTKRIEEVKAMLASAEQDWTRRWLQEELDALKGRLDRAKVRDEAMPTMSVSFYQYDG